MPTPPEPRAPRTIVVPKHYDTIQGAIDAAQAGDTVYVAPGVYSEHVVLKSGIRLLGAGAPITLWDGQGGPRNLIDYSGASDVEISGFTFRNVGSDTWCTMTDDLSRWCGGNWYASAIYADGHDAQTSALVTNNIFIGVQAGYVDIQRNVIVGSSVGVAHMYVQTGDIRCSSGTPTPATSASTPTPC